MKPTSTARRRQSGAVIAIGTAGALLLLSAGTAVAATNSPSPSRVDVPQGIGAAALANANVVGPASGSTKETVSFILKARDLAELESRVDAGMPGGQLSVARFAATYGQTNSSIAALTKYLASYTITSSVRGIRLDVTSTGTIAEYNAALGVHQKEYKLAAVPAADGRPGRAAVEFHGTSEPTTLPTGVARIVLSILGLTAYPTGSSNAVHTPSFASAAKPAGTQEGNLTPASFASRYDLTALQRSGALGQGQTIGIVTLASLRPADATHFWTSVLKIKTKANRITLDNIDGGAGPVSNNAGSGETSLDVEQSGALAPDADIIVYQAPNTDAGFIDAFATAASQDKASAVSSSWGESEDLVNSAVAAGTESTTYAAAFDEMFLELAAQGQSSFIAAGDSGAYDSDAAGNCVFSTAKNKCIPSTDLAVDEPGTSPWTTDAGGTTLAGTIPVAKGVNITISHQRAWGWDYFFPDWKKLGGTSESSFAEENIAGGGGGFSKVEATPGYQQGRVSVHHFSAVKYFTPTDPITQHGFTEPTGMTFTAHPSVTTGTGTGRAVPDVSADADPYTGYLLYFSGQSPALEPGWGGTSFVAPQLAGATAVLDSSLGHRVGFWNPAIYRFAAGLDSPFTPLDTAGTSNDNLYFTGTKGSLYNAATGLGTPNFDKLAADFRR